MNLLLLREKELCEGRSVLTGSRALHIIKILKAEKGSVLRAGVLNGSVGEACVTGIGADSVEISFTPLTAAPPPADITLVLALPRPKAFRRILFSAVSAGVKDIRIINTWRVEKSYWDSPYISPESVEAVCFEALAQAKDTVMPDVVFHRFFMEFMESSTPEHRRKLLAHPGNSENRGYKAPAVIAVGPEGGFIQKEADTFISNGYTPFSPLERTLTTEHFVPFILGNLTI